MSDPFFVDKRILITGATGFLGKHVLAKFKQKLKDNVGLVMGIGSQEVDLRKFKDVQKCFETVQPDIVIHLGADCGGIGYNRRNPGKLFYNNMLMNLNVIEACRLTAVRKLVNLGSVCGYPKFTPVPFKEENLFAGYPEETNAPYGLAKRDMLILGQGYRKQYGLNSIYLLMVNLYGEYDHFDGEDTHVIPALIKKFLNAKNNDYEEVELWGTGRPTREFLYARDASEAIFLATKLYDKPMPVNVGVGYEISIRELANKIKEIVGYEGRIVWNKQYPDGQPRRCLDVEKAKELFNFEARTSICEGLEKTIKWYIGQRPK